MRHRARRCPSPSTVPGKFVVAASSQSSTQNLLRALSRTSTVGGTALATACCLNLEQLVVMYQASHPPSTSMNGMGSDMIDGSGTINPAALNSSGIVPLYLLNFAWMRDRMWDGRRTRHGFWSGTRRRKMGVMNSPNDQAVTDAGA